MDFNNLTAKVTDDMQQIIDETNEFYADDPETKAWPDAQRKPLMALSKLLFKHGVSFADSNVISEMFIAGFVESEGKSWDRGFEAGFRSAKRSYSPEVTA